MKKRILALCLALAMIIGMLPMIAFADESTESTSVMIAESGKVTLDGSLSEAEWHLGGNLSGETDFGAIYDGDYLYLGLNAAVDSLSVTLNGVDVTAETVKGESTTEAKVSLEAAGLDLYEYNTSASLKVALGDSAWEGTVKFNVVSRTIFTGASVGTTTSDAGKAGGSNTSGVYNLYANKAGACAAGTAESRAYVGLSGTAAVQTSGVVIREFDIVVNAMPSYDISQMHNPGNYMFPGVNFAVYTNSSPTNAGLVAAISRIEGYTEGYEDLYLLIGNSTGTDHWVLPLNRAVGEQFHLRFEFTVDATDNCSDLVVYCDGVLIATLENVKNATGYTSSSGGFNINAWVKGADNIAKGEVNFTVSNVSITNAMSVNIMDKLAAGAILGENNSAENISSNLSLPAAITDTYLGNVNLVWTSSDTSIIGNDGVVVPDASGKVTMTAALAANPEITKSFELTVSYDVLDAVISTEEIVLDGVLSEDSWSAVCASNTWMADALWNNGSLWLAVETGDATSMKLTLGEKVWEIILAETVEAEGITGAVKDGVAELKIDLATAGIELADYGEKYAFQIEVGDTKLADEAIAIRFSGKEMAPVDWANPMFSVGGTTSAEGGTLTGTGKTCYVVSNHSVPGLGGWSASAASVYLTTELTLKSLPVLTEQPSFTSPTNVTNGLVFWLADCDTPTTSSGALPNSKGDIIALKFYNLNGELYVMVLDAAKGLTSFALGVALNESFELAFLWAEDDSLTIYVNGAALGTVQNANYRDSGLGLDVAYFRFDSTEVSASWSDMYIVGAPVHTTVVDELKSSIESAFAAYNLAEVSTDLPMNATVATEHLGDVKVTWESTNTTYVSNSGKVITPEAGSATSTITAKYGEEVLYTAEVTVVSGIASLDAVLATSGITVDGSVSDLAWVKWTAFEGDQAGTIGAAWDKGHLYLLVNSDAESLTLVIGSKTVNVDLVNGTTDLAGATAVKNGSIVEIDLPLAAMDVYPADYNATVDMSATLTGANGTSTLPVECVCFTGKTVNIQAVSNTSAGWTFSGSVYNYSYSQDSAVHYIYATGNNFSLTETTILSQDLCFTSMPVTTGAYESSSRADGYYYYANRNTGGTSHGDTFFVVIYNAGDGKLMANILQNQAEPNATIDLGVSVGESFRLTTAWAPDGSIALFVNGSLVGKSNGSATYYATYMGNNVLTFRYATQIADSSAAEMVEFQLQNVTLLKTAYETVLDEMTVESILNRADLDHIRNDLPMGSTFESEYFEALPVSWITSDASVIEADGTIHRGETAKSCQITLVYEGQELWTVDATLDPITVTEPATAPIYTTAYANDVVIDGSLMGENWHMANKILANGILVGEMGASWNLDYLNVAIRNSGAAITLNVNGVAIDLTKVTYAVSGEYTEIAIPMVDLGLAINSYGLELPVTVTVGDGSYTGTLRLVGTDWWGAGNAEDPLPMLSNYVKSVAMSGGGNPDGNQGAVEVTNGWHFYDYYAEDGTNPSGVRTYALFMRTSPYENFGVRNGTTSVEFDIQVLSLPVYDLDAALETPNAAFATYGINWSLADAADAAKNSNVITGGVVNTKDGLVLVISGNRIVTFELGKELGDLFRITMDWNVDNSLDVYIDGELLTTLNDQAMWCNSVGDTSFVINMLRSLDAPTDSDDDMDVYITNIAFGTAASENPLDDLSWNNIKGENSAQASVTSDLILPDQLVNEQLGHTFPVTWTSTHPEIVDPETGVVIRPEKGVVKVILTASLESGETLEFVLFVIGESTDPGNTLVVTGDKDPAHGVGIVNKTPLFTFDINNNSIIIDLEQKQAVNVVKLTDTDEFARLNRESLTLWVSDDNATYTQIEDYKLLHAGENWYLYGFEAEAQYVKVHYTHFDGADADFLAPLDGIITAYSEEIIGAGTGDWQSKNYDYTNASDKAMQDERVEISKSELGITGEDASIRVYLGTELLYHYVDGDSIYVRVPDIAVGETVTLTVKYGTEGALDIANKEACIEVTAGTRETYLVSGARWIFDLPAGEYTLGTVEESYLLAAGAKSFSASFDGGVTWSTFGSVDAEAQTALTGKGDVISGGFMFDSVTGRILYECHYYDHFTGGDMDDSYCVNVVIYSDDFGKTWKLADVIEPDTVEGKTYNYMLSYSDGLMVTSTYDGADGPGVDFVFPTGAQYNTNGAFACRVAYSTDGGMTWEMSPTILTYGNETAFEGGMSEGWILENDDGVLVLYSRCQSSGVDNFAMCYSHDGGKTWTTCKTKAEWEASGETGIGDLKCLTSSVYTVNTQALMFEYMQDNGADAPIFLWGGNNVSGGSSYARNPLNVAVSYDGLETWRNIQNLFSETFMETYGSDASHYITNPSVAQSGDDLVVTFTRLRLNNSVYMRVDNFTDYLYRTKGAYDDFESGNAYYEGWVSVVGEAKNVSTYASAGAQSLLLPGGTLVTRSIPYLQDGKISLDVYVTADTSVTYELQPAFAKVQDKCSVADIVIENMTASVGDVSIELTEGWNTIEIELELTGSSATLSANGGKAQPIALNMSVGDYVCYVTAFTSVDTYMDEFTVVSYLDAEVYTGETQKKEAGADVAEVEEMIDAIGVVTLESEAAIQAAVNAYNALSDEEKAEVSNYETLTAAAEALNWLQTDGNGMYVCSDGQTRYYVDGVATYAGLIQIDGEYYYVNSQCLVVKSCSYAIGEAKTNGLLPAGTYEFDEEGKLIQREGLVVDEDGEIRYYVNFVATYAGVVQDAEGNLYYINSSKKAVKNCSYAIGAGKTNGLVEAGTYEFDADGKMIIVPEEELKNGLVVDEDGEIRYYVDGVATYAGVVQDDEGNLYYINSSKKAVKNCTYGIGASKTNGLIAAGTYEIDENGHIIVPKNGLSFDEDGEIRYYVDGVATYAGVVQDAEGNLYYINSSKKAVKSRTYGIGASKTNGLIAAGTYEIDENGHIIVE